MIVVTKVMPSRIKKIAKLENAEIQYPSPDAMGDFWRDIEGPLEAGIFGRSKESIVSILWEATSNVESSSK